MIITDIKGSTKAIEGGRYQDVNMLGAASISVIQELFDHDFPFVFGGDGATIVIPSMHCAKVFYALCGLRTLSRINFKLELRVGCVSVEDIDYHGGTIELAKYELSSEKCIAIFRGGGLNMAEDLIKSDQEQYDIPFQGAPASALKGLTCNWRPIPSKRGTILSLLVVSKVHEVSVYADFLHFLDSIFEGDFNEANPVNAIDLKMKNIFSIVKNHFYMASSYLSKNVYKEALSSISIVLSQWIPMPNLGTHRSGRIGTYIPTMRTHADFRKFDDVLRMVLDCTDTQVEAIERYLEIQFDQQRLNYGTHQSNTALMTCYVQDIVPRHHIHFIDGGDGGYAMAAKRLKSQLKSDRTSSSNNLKW